ncbi:MAG: TatD family hydrolase [Muribaculum sp.]|nr:TatD family hydrolase [Muribaculum sp.]
MIDTHTHLYMQEAYADGGEGAVKRALASGVSHMVLPGVDLNTVEPLLALHGKFPDRTSVGIGIHPTELSVTWRQDIERMRELYAGVSYVAWGEIGIDLHWEKDSLVRQMDAFGYQMDLAGSEGKPVIIHSRDALDETLEVIRMMGSGRPALLFHSFTGGVESLDRILTEVEDAMFGINGVVTFKNAGELREAVARAGLSRIVLETDSPYLAPAPHRGETNESRYLNHVLDAVANITGTPRDEAERQTDENAIRYFGLKT